MAPLVDPVLGLAVVLGLFLAGNFAAGFVLLLVAGFDAASEVLPPAGWADAGAAKASINKATAVSN